MTRRTSLPIAVALVLAVAVLAGPGCRFEDRPPTAAADTSTTPPEDTGGGAGGPDVAAAVDTVAAESIRVAGPANWVSDADREPLFVRQTWQRDPAHTVTIQWRTAELDADGYEPKVWYAKATDLEEADGEVSLPFGEGHVATGAAYNFQTVWTGDTVFMAAEVELTGLEPYTHYVFRAGTWDDVDEAEATLVNPTLTDVHHFQTGLEPGSSEPFTFVVAGDSRGGYDDVERHTPRLASLAADFWMFSGDMTETGLPEEWDTWYEAMAAILDDHVFMPVQGNHEVFGEYYYYQFALPREEGLPPEYQEHHWSMKYGNALVIGLNSLNTSTVGDSREWLDRRLTDAADDPDVVWRIVMFHHPAYSSSNHKSTTRVQRDWVPIFEKHGVDITFAGHDHNYERTVPIRGDQEVGVGEGVVHVTAGAFFAPPYSNGNDWWTVVSHHGDKANYCVVDVDGDSLTVTAYSGDGNEVLDEFTLTK